MAAVDSTYAPGERVGRFVANIEAVRGALQTISEWSDDNGRVSEDMTYHDVLRTGMDIIDGNESYARLFRVV
jgi:hypothetical protein